MNRRRIALGVVFASALAYAGLVIAAVIVIARAGPDDRETLMLAAVVGLLVAFFGVLAIGLLFVPAFFLAQRTGGGALPYLVWGAGTFALAGLQLRDTLHADGARSLVFACAATGAMLGAAFWLGVRRGS